MRRTLILSVCTFLAGPWAYSEPDGTSPLPVDGDYVPLLGQEFLPKLVPHEKSIPGHQSDIAYFNQFISLPLSGTGYQAIGEEAILWGSPDVIHNFESFAKTWAGAGGKPILVYALSAKNPMTHRVDNDLGTFWGSHLYGRRKKKSVNPTEFLTPFLLKRYTNKAAGSMHNAGTEMDIREFQSPSANATFMEAMARNMGSTTRLYIYDMMTAREIADKSIPTRSPLHVSMPGKKGLSTVFQLAYWRLIYTQLSALIAEARFGPSEPPFNFPNTD